jgi:hypothetical protein
MSDASKAILLGLVACGLALAVTLELAAPSPGVEAPRRAAPIEAVEAPPAPAEPAALVATILARPLFDPGRRPVSAPGASTPGIQAPPRLAGILHGATFRRAIFQGRDGKPVTAGVGDTIAGRTVKRVEPTQVVLEGPNGEEILDLAGDPSAAARSQARPAEPAGAPPPGQLPPPDPAQPPPPEEGPPDAPRADMPSNPLASQPPQE